MVFPFSYMYVHKTLTLATMYVHDTENDFLNSTLLAIAIKRIIIEYTFHRHICVYKVNMELRRD